MIYLIIFLFLSVSSFAEVILPKLKYTHIFIYGITLLTLILFAGLRFKTGYDFFTYKEIFDAVKFGENNQSGVLIIVEPGFIAIIEFVKFFTSNFQGLLFLMAFITITLKFKYFYNLSPFNFVAVLIYFTSGFLINEMGQIRQGLAIALVLFAFKYLIEGNNKKFFLLSSLAFLFHFSVVFVFPVYFLLRKKISTKKLLYALIPLTLFFLVDIRPLLLSILDLIPMAQLQSKATFYLYSEEFGHPLGFNLSFILRVLIFVTMIYFQDRGNSKFSFYEKLIPLYFYGIILYVLFNSVADFAIRSSLYFKSLECIILPCFITFGKTRFDKAIILALVILYSFWSLYKLLYDTGLHSDFLPYKSVFNF